VKCDVRISLNTFYCFLLSGFIYSLRQLNRQNKCQLEHVLTLYIEMYTEIIYLSSGLTLKSNFISHKYMDYR